MTKKMISDHDLETLIHGYDLKKFLTNREADIAAGEKDFGLLQETFEILFDRQPRTGKEKPMDKSRSETS